MSSMVAWAVSPLSTMDLVAHFCGLSAEGRMAGESTAWCFVSSISQLVSMQLICLSCCRLCCLIAAKIVIIVLCAVSALVVVVLSAVYTRRAIDRRLAHVHVHEEVRVEEQHVLLGADAMHRGVVVSVERPVVLADRHSSSSSRDPEEWPSNSGGSSWAGWAGSRLQTWASRLLQSLQRSKGDASSSRGSSTGGGYHSAAGEEDHNSATVSSIGAAVDQLRLNGTDSGGSHRHETDTGSPGHSGSVPGSSCGIGVVLRGAAPSGPDNRSTSQQHRGSRADLHHLR